MQLSMFSTIDGDVLHVVVWFVACTVFRRR